MESNRRVPLWAAALIGLVSGAVAVGVSLLVAGLVKASAFPVVAVGNAAVDLTPAALKDFAIRTFGENDKTVLLTGIFLVLAAIAAAVGVLAVRDIRYGLAGLAAFGAVGVLAVLTRPGAAAVDVVPTVVGVAAAMFALYRLIARALTPAGGPQEEGWSVGPQEAGPLAGPAGTGPHDGRAAVGGRGEERHGREPVVGAGGEERYGAPVPPVMRAGSGPYPFDRRRLLIGTLGGVAAAGVAGLAGRMLSGRAEVAAARVGMALPRPAVPAAPLPTGVDLRIRGLSPFVTPNHDFYRVDTALVVPQVDPRNWTLRIHGMVDRPVELTFADLMKRPLEEADITLCCVSNEVGGPYVGNARWLGTSLAGVLRDAGVRKGADMLLSTSADGWTCGTPVDVVLDGRDALLAFGMNGEALPVEHGFPVRQVVPGLYGYVSATKWVTDIKVTRFDRDEAYWTPKGWSAMGPVKTQSRIDLPRDGARVAPGRTVIAGVAWAQHKGVEAVEVRIDRGQWRQARLAVAPTADTWRQWVVDDWDATPGSHTIEVRATDATGYTQTPDLAPVAPDGATGWHSVSVDVA
ncbi:molybdopterin-dependent oxidoreductase [Streptosporangium minutum]|uniref:Oxidoreductase n=1 Tax=Streptosporangium minutum TaxID=569862 RepID=A0A243QWF8_9ACTN|nr:molybdopterin-dependent oxidoreductase [Streptosporangium minutum]OUC86511.1 oxidoreductase [Streptosporangium minutum]